MANLSDEFCLTSTVISFQAAFADDDFDEEIAEITSNQAAEIEMAISTGKLDCDVSDGQLQFFVDNFSPKPHRKRVSPQSYLHGKTREISCEVSTIPE